MALKEIGKVPEDVVYCPHCNVPLIAKGKAFETGGLVRIRTFYCCETCRRIYEDDGMTEPNTNNQGRLRE